jgi:hypothetical protein
LEQVPLIAVAKRRSQLRLDGTPSGFEVQAVA